jgi:hypothetical protein
MIEEEAGGAIILASKTFLKNLHKMRFRFLAGNAITIDSTPHNYLYCKYNRDHRSRLYDGF